MTKIRFDNGTVTISDGFVQAPSPTLTALLDALAATLPGSGSIPFVLDEDFNIAKDLLPKNSVVCVAALLYSHGYEACPRDFAGWRSVVPDDSLERDR